MPTPTSQDNTDELKKAIRKTYDVKTSHYVNFEPRLEKLMAVIEPFIALARTEAAREARIATIKHLISILWDTEGQYYYKDDVPHEVLQLLDQLSTPLKSDDNK